MTTYTIINGKVYAVESNPRPPSSGPYVRSRRRIRGALSDLEKAENENRKIRAIAKKQGYHTRIYTGNIKSAMTARRYLWRALAAL